jgi:hypothetical protein
MFTIVIRNREGSPVKGEVSAADVDAAIGVARQMGHDVDEEATRKLAELALNTSGRAAATAGFLMALTAVFFPYCGIGAVVLSVMAIELSKSRRGLVSLTASILLTGVGMVLRYMNLLLIRG